MTSSRVAAEPGHDRPSADRLLDADQLEARSSAVERAAGAETAALFTAAMRRTLDQTLHRLPDGSIFVITGDIPAMWLRDSTTQLLPYLRLVADDPGSALTEALLAVLRRQLILIGHDPYANAFNLEPNGRCHDPRDLSDDPLLWERKYEIDSLSFPFQLAHRLWDATGRSDHLGQQFLLAARRSIETLRRETEHEERSDYRFVRLDGPASETLDRGGRGSPVGRTGMTWSGFRPSDDACELGYNVPGNLMVAHTLRLIAQLCRDGARRPAPGLALEAEDLADQIGAGVEEHGLVGAEGGDFYAYEVDGLGSSVLMDDANMPSLLSLPLTAGVARDDPRYRRTRAFVLSSDNPYYFTGRVTRGIGSPHTPDRHVWPIALAVEGLTGDDVRRRAELLAVLTATTAGTGSLHESFHVDDDTVFTRPWFSWADSMFCELAMVVSEDVNTG